MRDDHRVVDALALAQSRQPPSHLVPFLDSIHLPHPQGSLDLDQDKQKVGTERASEV